MCIKIKKEGKFPFILRTFEDSDIDSYMDILKVQKDVYANLRPNYPVTKEQLKELLARKDVNTLIVEISNKVAGSVAFGENEDGTIELSRLWIEEGSRTAGLGSEIMKTLFQYLSDTYNTEEVCVKVLQSNTNAIKMLKTIEGVKSENISKKTIDVKEGDKLLYYILRHHQNIQTI